MNRFHLSPFLIALFCCCCLCLSAQSEPCLDFEELPADARYGRDGGHQPGDLAFSEAGVDVYLDEFVYNAHPETGFWNADVSQDIFGDQAGLDGQFLFVSNINLLFDFSSLDHSVGEVCFNIVDGGGEENISVNGGPLHVVNSLQNVPQEIAPGVIMRWEHIGEGSPNNIPNLRICLRGEIKTLLIGGQEMALDNVCYGAPVDCRLYDLKAEIVNCQPTTTNAFNVYDVWLNLSHLNENGLGFDVFINNEFHSFHAYSDLPLVLEEVKVPAGTDHFVLTVCENDNPNCCTSMDLPNPGCEPGCRLEAVDITQVECTGAGYYFARFHVKGDHLSGQVTITNSLGETWTGPADGSEAVKFSINPQGYDRWVVCDRQSPDCCKVVEFDIPCQPCRIGPLKVEATDCTDDGQFYFVLNFEHQTPTGQFYLYLNQEKYGAFAYQQLPLRIGPLQADANLPWHLLVRDASEQCAEDISLDPVDCGIHPCRIGELHFSEAECTDDGKFFFKVDFEYQHTSEKFELFLNGESYEHYAYADLPIVVGPLAPNSADQWKVLVKDRSGLCASDGVLGPVDCGGGGDCQFSDLIIERHPCIGGNFWVDLAFEAKQPGGQGYYVFADGEISGPHAYNQPFITLGPFAGDANTIYDFLVIDIADPACYAYYELGPVDCSHPCTIDAVIAEAHPCQDDGSFLVDIAFIYDKVGSSGFTIRGNGNNYGSFDYGKPFYTIGPIKGDGQLVYEFVIIDNDNEECRAFTTLQPIDCTPCKIGELQVGTVCKPDSPFFVLELDFDHQHPNSDRFRLTSGDHHLGDYAYADLPLRLELELPPNGELPLRVCDLENEACCRETIVTLPCCALSELIVEAHPCQQDGQVWFDLDLKYYNTGGSFQVVYGRQGGPLHSGTYAYTDLPLTLGPLPSQGAANWFFEVTDESYYCQTSTQYEVPYCDNDACAEWETTAAGAYGPLTGYGPGKVISREDGVRLRFAGDNPADCACSVFVLNATTIPAFTAAAGQMLLLHNSAAAFDFPKHQVTSLQMDYFYDGSQVRLRVNGQAAVTADHPLQLPGDIAPGVKLKVSPLTNDGRQGTMLFTGQIERLVLQSRGRWALDNLCLEKTEKKDDVWPGDTNKDNIANHLDLLNIGLAFGAAGPERDNTSMAWAAQAAADWPELFFDDGNNYKHADSDGDGFIDRTDRLPIRENYGLTHGPVAPIAVVPAKDDDPPLYVDFTAIDAIPVGGTFQVPIVFGTQNQPVADLYGLAFTITFDPEVIKPESIEVVYPESWIGNTEEDVITIDRRRAEAGKLDVAITRIDQLNVGGFGPIASLIGAIDDIAGKHTTVGVTEVVAINAGEDRLPVNPQISEVEFTDNIRPEIGYIDLNRSLNVFPNPTSSEVIITTKFNFPILSIRVLDGYGNPTGLSVRGKNRIDLQSLPAGVYCLRISLSEYTISRKIVKIER